MPRRDGTGPMGAGRGMGRGLGNCGVDIKTNNSSEIVKENTLLKEQISNMNKQMEKLNSRLSELEKDSETTQKIAPEVVAEEK